MKDINKFTLQHVAELVFAEEERKELEKKQQEKQIADDETAPRESEKHDDVSAVQTDDPSV